MAYTRTESQTRKPNQIITKRIISALSEGIIPWKRPWEALDVMSIDGRPYRGVNRLLLSWAGYSDPRFVTFNKCREMGGNVKKGEKGWPVVLWHWQDVRVTEKDSSDNPISRAKQVPFMRYYYVFNVEQCDGIADKLKPIAQKTIDFQPIDEARRIVDNYTNCPKIKHGGNVASYSPLTDTVRMPVPETFVSAEHYYATELHELVHSTGHAARLNRHIANSFSAVEYSKEELIAEIGSAFLCAEAHIDVTTVNENTIAYIQSWIQVLQNDPNMVIQAASAAQKAVDYILGSRNAVDEPIYESAESDQAVELAT